MDKLNLIYRVIVTGGAFSLFNLGGLVLSIIVFPSINLFYCNQLKRQAAAKKVVHYTFKGFVAYMKLAGIIRVQIENKAALSQAQGKVIIANHPSLIDVVVLISLIKNADCVVKSGLWRKPFIKGVVKSTGYINNDAEPEVFLKNCKTSLNNGNNLIIFPEGTRTEPGCEPVFKRGASNIAVRTQTDLLPLLIDVKPTTLTKGEKWYQVAKKRVVVRLKVLPDYSVKPYCDNPDIAAKSVRSLTRDLESYIRKEIKAYE
ncbi:1-acyl-sn-glycerol-3-phosphate acyltransferase [Catenovulum sp. 2E275]|uniref:lysophospholipid acyltransferase family protein n=1 Tax=Catenovulum sp. 2E275 TaxID=2980497 RepID=UPI0021D22AFE|nr:lysophospholipid acyltransferase family protein [Catenovulum sp. 2E275]MCU4676663.1 1-acyl-sn-glycerol-3-phosphate acyltransferase [Catenovulum sp. 2E275]